MSPVNINAAKIGAVGRVYIDGHININSIEYEGGVQSLELC